MNKFLLSVIAILCLIIAVPTVLADSYTIDPNNVGSIVMLPTATMCIGSTSGTCLSANGLTLASGATVSANMYNATADQTVALATDSSVFNTSAGNYIGTTTIPSNILTKGKSFTVTGYGIYTTPALNTATALLKIQIASSTGSTIIASDTSATLIASAAAWNYNWTYTCTVRSTGAAGTLQCDGLFGFATTAGGSSYAYVNLSGSGTINTTIPLTINATNAWSTISGGQSATEKQTTINWNN